MTLSKGVSLNLSLYAFILCNPYLKWVLSNELLGLFFLVTSSLLTIILIYKNRIIQESKRNLIFIVFLLYILYFSTPIIHDVRLGQLVWSIPFVYSLYYNKEIIYNSFTFLKKIFYWISIFALIFWVLNMIHIPIPYYKFVPDFRYNSNDYYKIYGLAISLYSGNLPVGGEFGIERITGVFAEPGHFGIYLGLLLAGDNFDFNNKDNKVLIAAGFLTFSTAFYSIILLGIIYYLFIEKKFYKKINKIIFIIALAIGVGISIWGEAFTELILGRVLYDKNSEVKSIEEIVDSRISNKYIEDFTYFVKSDNVYFGMGYYDIQEMPTTNWRGLIYRFGITGLVLLFILVLVIIKTSDIKFSFILTIIFIIILSHRSYLLYTPCIYFLIYLSSFNYNFKNYY